MSLHNAASDLKSKNLPLIMFFRTKFLYGGRQQNYFHVKILILVCPDRTCKRFEGFCIVMIVKMRIFREFLPDHEDFVSGISFVSIYNNFEQS